jgi:hypothetical protein
MAKSAGSFVLHALRIHDHRGPRLDDVGHALEADPQAREAAHRVAVQAEIEVVLDVRRIEHRDAAGFQDVLALVRERRGLRRVVVAGEHEHAAVLRGARGVGVLEDVAAAVHAGALAVPHAEDAVVARAREHAHLLRAPEGGGREILVHAGLEPHVVRLEMLLRAPQRLVQAAQRRAAIPRDEAGRVEPGAPVALALQQEQPDQRLRPREEYAPLVERVLVVQRNLGELAGIDRCVHRSVLPWLSQF